MNREQLEKGKGYQRRIEENHRTMQGLDSMIRLCSNEDRNICLRIETTLCGEASISEIRASVVRELAIGLKAFVEKQIADDEAALAAL